MSFFVTSLPTLLRVLLLLILIVQTAQPVQAEDSTTEGERLISSSAGLKLESVYFAVRTDHEYAGVIAEKILQTLIARGLHTNTDWPYQRGKPLLQLTVRTEALPDCQSGKVLYYQNLDLFETVISERSPHIKTWSRTWTYGLGDPTVTEAVSFEQLQKDADELIEGFITDFLYANKK